MSLCLPEPCFPYAMLQRPGADYLDTVRADFEQMEPYLPDRVDTIADIGCGLGGISVLLKQKYPGARLTLIDLDGEAEQKDWQRGGFAASRDLTALFMLENGVAGYEWVEPEDGMEIRADLVVSLLSWGFHYPLSTYRVSGLCVADIRLKHEAVPSGWLIAKHAKSVRMAFRP